MEEKIEAKEVVKPGDHEEQKLIYGLSRAMDTLKRMS
jgi:hypothetical protein